MSNSVTLAPVSMLRPNGKQVLEDLLGQNLQDNQQVLIMVLSPDTEPDKTARLQARAGLEAIFRKTDAYAIEHGVSDEEVDAAIDEAMQQIRGRKK